MHDEGGPIKNVLAPYMAVQICILL